MATSRNDKRVKRHRRARKDLIGTPEKPRLCVFRSNKNIYAQIIDDVSGKTLVQASSIDKELKESIESGGNKEGAKLVGAKLGERAVAAGINEVAFDRAGFIYHGRIKELADGAREAGLKF